MSETMHAFLNERLRLSLSGHIPGHLLDAFVASLSHFFKTVRPDLTPSKVLIAVSEPSICGSTYCSCNSADGILHKYKITIFVDRKEQGRRVTKPWLRASSDVGFEDAVVELMKQSDELVAEVEGKKSAEAETQSRKKLLGTERFEIRSRKSATCLVEVFEKERGRERGFTMPSGAGRL